MAYLSWSLACVAFLCAGCRADRYHSAALQAYLLIVDKSSSVGKAGIDFQLTGGVPGSTNRIAFTLPDEVMGRTEWSVKRGTAFQTLSREIHTGHTVFSFATFTITYDRKGRFEAKYVATIGKQIESASVGRNGPQYGYIDGSHIVTMLDYLLPAVRDTRYTVTVKRDQGPGSQIVSGKTTSSGAFDRVVAIGPFHTSIVKVSDSLDIEVSTVNRLSDQVSKYLTRIGRRLRSIAGDQALPRIVGLPANNTQKFVPMISSTVIALDLQSLTPERAVRVAETLMRALLFRRPPNSFLTGPTDYRLIASMARYVALEVAWETGLLDRNNVLYELAEEYSRYPELRISFYRDLPNQVYVTNLVEGKGILALTALGQQVRNGTSGLVDTLAKMYIHQRVHSVPLILMTCSPKCARS